MGRPAVDARPICNGLAPQLTRRLRQKRVAGGHAFNSKKNMICTSSCCHLSYPSSFLHRDSLSPHLHLLLVTVLRLAWIAQHAWVRITLWRPSFGTGRSGASLQGRSCERLTGFPPRQRCTPSNVAANASSGNLVCNSERHHTASTSSVASVPRTARRSVGNRWPKRVLCAPVPYWAGSQRQRSLLLQGSQPRLRAEASGASSLTLARQPQLLHKIQPERRSWHRTAVQG